MSLPVIIVNGEKQRSCRSLKEGSCERKEGWLWGVLDFKLGKKET
jgi:hypothetical protein